MPIICIIVSHDIYLTWKYLIDSTYNAQQFYSRKDESRLTYRHRRTYHCAPSKTCLSTPEATNTIDTLITELETISSEPNPTKLNKNFSTFCNIIKSEVDGQSPNNTRRYGPSPKPWWNSDLSICRKELKEAQKKWLACNRSDPIRLQLWRIFRNKQKVFDTLVRHEKRKYQNRMNLNLVNHLSMGNSQKFWKLFDKISITSTPEKNTLPRSLLNANGTLTSDPQEIKDIWHNYFKNLLNPPYQQQPNQELVTMADDLVQTLQTNNNQTQWEPYLNREISLEEVTDAVYSLKDKKAAGPDGLGPSTLKNINTLKYLHKLFNLCFKKSLIPDEWYYSSLTPIYKGIGNKYDTNNYRGIAVQSCITKCYCKILNNRLTAYLDSNDLLCEEQGGFRKNRSCQDQIFSLFSIIENRKSRKKDTFACFVDFKKAFDSIPREKLWSKLNNIGINGLFLSSIRGLYSNTQYAVCTENGTTDWFQVNTGVKQGCVLSPTLFNIYINDLPVSLREVNAPISFGNIKIDALLYADDLVIIADSPRILQNKLNSLTSYCNLWNLSINPDKTKTVHFRNNRKPLDSKIFKCCNAYITYTDKYKYLGVIFTEHLSLKATIEATSISASRAASLLICKSRTSGNFNYNVYSKIYESLILPVINYSSFLWGFKSYDQVNKIQFKLIRNFLGLNRNVPLDALIGEMGWKPISCLTKITCIKFWKRLHTLHNNRITKAVFIEACRLAEQGTHNWVSSVNNLFSSYWPQYSPPATLDLNSIVHLTTQSICVNYDLLWYQNINRIPYNSSSGGRLNLYRNIKFAPKVDSYIMRCDKGRRRAIAGLRTGCLPLAVEVGRYTSIPFDQRTCQVCAGGEVEDQAHFLLDCCKLNIIRKDLFTYCTNLNPNFTCMPPSTKLQYLLTSDNTKVINFIYRMYNLRQSLLFPS